MNMKVPDIYDLLDSFQKSDERSQNYIIQASAVNCDFLLTEMLAMKMKVPDIYDLLDSFQKSDERSQNYIIQASAVNCDFLLTEMLAMKMKVPDIYDLLDSFQKSDERSQNYIIQASAVNCDFLLTEMLAMKMKVPDTYDLLDSFQKSDERSQNYIIQASAVNCDFLLTKMLAMKMKVLNYNTQASALNCDFLQTERLTMNMKVLNYITQASAENSGFSRTERLTMNIKDLDIYDLLDSFQKSDERSQNYNTQTSAVNCDFLQTERLTMNMNVLNYITQASAVNSGFSRTEMLTMNIKVLDIYDLLDSFQKSDERSQLQKDTEEDRKEEKMPKRTFQPNRKPREKVYSILEDAERRKIRKSKPKISALDRRLKEIRPAIQISSIELQNALDLTGKIPEILWPQSSEYGLPERRLLLEKRKSSERPVEKRESSEMPVEKQKSSERPGNSYITRMQSFTLGLNSRNTKWNNDRFVLVGPLVAAGLSYEGKGNNVVCNSCGFRCDTSLWRDNDEEYAFEMHRNGQIGACTFLSVFSSNKHDDDDSDEPQSVCTLLDHNENKQGQKSIQHVFNRSSNEADTYLGEVDIPDLDYQNDQIHTVIKQIITIVIKWICFQ